MISSSSISSRPSTQDEARTNSWNAKTGSFGSRGMNLPSTAVMSARTDKPSL